MTHLTRALLRFQRGDRAGALADADVVAGESADAAESLRSYAAIVFRALRRLARARDLRARSRARAAYRSSRRTSGTRSATSSASTPRGSRACGPLFAPCGSTDGASAWLPPDPSHLLPAARSPCGTRPSRATRTRRRSPTATRAAPETVEIDERAGRPTGQGCRRCWRGARRLGRGQLVVLGGRAGPRRAARRVAARGELAVAMKMFVQRTWRIKDRLSSGGWSRAPRACRVSTGRASTSMRCRGTWPRWPPPSTSPCDRCSSGWRARTRCRRSRTTSARPRPPQNVILWGPARCDSDARGGRLLAARVFPATRSRRSYGPDGGLLRRRPARVRTATSGTRACRRRAAPATPSARRAPAEAQRAADGRHGRRADRRRRQRRRRRTTAGTAGIAGTAGTGGTGNVVGTGGSAAGTTGRGGTTGTAGSAGGSGGSAGTAGAGGSTAGRGGTTGGSAGGTTGGSAGGRGGAGGSVGTAGSGGSTAGRAARRAGGAGGSSGGSAGGTAVARRAPAAPPAPTASTTFD